MARWVQLGLCLGLLAQSGLAQSNCARVFHSAVVNNDTVWIAGGDMHVVWPNHTITSHAIRDLQTLDLTRSWTNSDDDLFKDISRPWNSSDPQDYPPWLDEGDSWSDGESIYFYGGFTSGWGGPPVPPLATWRYDISANNWTRDGFSGAPLVRLCEGGVAQSNVHNTAHYLSGVLHPNGNPTFAGTAGATTYMDTGLISLDMTTQEWTNHSTTDMNTWGTIGDGYTALIDSIGDEGLLVAFGGYTHPVGEAMSILASSHKDNSTQNSMEDVRVYDIANQTWYTQKTTGDIPHWRMSGCTVVAAAPDLSSYSIYIFGGMAPTTQNSDGNVYVLSIPSFRWIKVSDDTTVRIKHQCALVQNHIMLVVGGLTPVTNNEFTPLSRNCDSATFANGIGLFDLHSLSWQTNYNASDNSSYTIPSKVYNVIGGNETGGSTVNEPEQGFNSTDMATLFQKRTATGTSTAQPTASGSDSTANDTKNSISSGAIAGATVGAVAGAAVVVAVAFYLIRRRRQSLAADEKGDQYQSLAGTWRQPQTHPKELSGDEPIYEMASDHNYTVEMPTEVTHHEMPTEGSRA